MSDLKAYYRLQLAVAVLYCAFNVFVLGFLLWVNLL